ncbi:hypothetical protein CANINC_003815 [Pichia inconspicua]|uniref:NAA35-like N-terminal domain-containing protein n=1 Tax=Pichia inconspicua TaxID=52247 RepID=A0A4T0WXY1_9ASCO|nr:hypothetical protein CANINC_003815 [[Candida] inconspicua]
MSDIVSSFKDISLDGTDDLVDITDLFFKTTSTIPYSDIIKSNNFSLLQGTHALELQNPRLDTFQLDLVPYEISKYLTLSQATAIISTQLKALSSWLDDNVGLPTSILSSEYICNILFNNTNKKPVELENGNIHIELVNRHSALIIAVVKFIIELAMKSQIYEEEDLNTSTMNLDWFENLNDNQIKSLTNVKVEIWDILNSNSNSENQNYISLIRTSFNLLNSLLELKSIFSWNIPLFKSDQTFQNKLNNLLQHLDDIATQLDSIDLPNIDSLKSPEGSFNTNSQVKFDNQAPPKEVLIFKLEWSQCVRNLNNMINDIVDVVKIVKANNVIELVEWLKYLENKRNNNDIVEINGLHIISRVLLFSWMRNNKSNESQDLVFNIPNFDFKQLLWQLLIEFSLENSVIDKSFKNGKSSDALEQINYYFDSVAQLWKEILFLPTLNPSRQRQFKCKELKYWNMRQIETGNLEEYFKQIRFYASNEPYPLTQTIMYFKLKSIQEIIIKSVELNLYKDVREFLSVYYQLTLISYQIDVHLERLIKMKKAYKSDLFYLMFLKNENSLILQLAIAKCKVFELLTSMGHHSLPKNIINKTPSTEGLMYNLQWKQINSIKDPEMLSFTEFKKRVNERINILNSIVFEEVMTDEITDTITTFTKAITMCNLLINKLNWFDELKGIKLIEIEKLKDEMMKTKQDIELLVQTKVNNTSFKVEIKRANRHRYFPGIKLN